ncbi:MAG: Toxin-antitoxin system, antitoxin component, Xre family [Candidatus Woesebacteria bacterium GW2011_GWA1_33_30]|uniref:Toxin-antitoxin system, antitoxin component, Xre family n=1 Tax=Candidatus Woesebacteria bacterium GW2011_GWA2_33_28 TaxID=1618561 RepID=A0A0G0CVA9_9BACT|nr:MAG: Toxin-antitoxin system, antitoxin component, Xre family [Candidatus Woesebacteria bacterium GW2011_GWA2_33_28]KKP48148.1 MAG: Toxin-antitoxin system, antitoxin component, Xre family [Candidatus Woesebacteria bacterium GW2011_GWA1_33_30]KKP49390.1 MAG: hypothetical protein UR40_C0006G0030 [Microgenomates group bacterium GW2011_GWC1_33_32]KKP52116.1 MAG: Toxin-antitoxin system, antitoxin component, Xre family [Candidatus Woesebacteria bacterium GW2011_GWB1_33_38]KKP57591.1 MAG: Toxin-anti
MKTKKLKLEKIIKRNTVSSGSVFRDFTAKQKKIVDAEIKYYDVLVGLKNQRKRMGFSQKQLAERASLPRTTITKIESGSYNPTINTLISIAYALNKKLELKFAEFVFG